MPEIGEIKYGREIGKKHKMGKFIWHACIDCGKERWIRLYASGETFTSGRCFHCSCKLNVYHQQRGALSTNWKGGRYLTSRGYVGITLQPDDFFFPMTGANGHVLEHRLVVAKALGRCLQTWEHVHHKHAKYPAGSREDKQDNRYPENLSLEFASNHNQMTTMENKIRTLKRKVKELEAIIAKLTSSEKRTT